MKKLFTLALLVSFSGHLIGQSDIAAYSGESSPSAISVANSSAAALSRGSGISSNSGGTFNSRNWNASNAAGAVSENDYIEWSITADAGYIITVNTIEIDYDRSNTGPDELFIRTSLDGFSNDIYTDSGFSSSGAQPTINLGTSLVSSNGGTITFRLYAFGASSGSGTFDIEDDIGTVLGQANTGIRLEGSVDVALSNPVVGFSQSNSSFPEGNTGSDIKTIGVELTNYQGTPVTVTITDAGTGTANSSSDYTFGSQMLTFNANGVQTIDLSINGDTNLETNETIDLVLAVTSGTANIATSNHTVTIVNDDAGAATAQPFFNEIHYDDAGGDNTEFIEVAVPVSFPGNLSDILVTLYNGSNGSSYDTDDLTSFTEGSTEDGYTFYTLVYATNGIQNGAPDGFALSNNGVLIEFLSYEGIMTANNGVASGEMSTDIGVSESGSETEGQSLQRTGSCTGTCPDGLSWTGPITSTLGTKNTNESLPIELRSFNAQLVNKQVKLTWQTASETNNDYMVVERRTANAFEAIGQVAGAGTTEKRQSYEWIDSNPAAGTNYYRLKQVDFDGEYEYHRVVSVEVGREQATQLWPNPVTDHLYIHTDASVTEIQVVDVLGQQVEVEMMENGINMAFLPQGVYYVVVKTLRSKDTFQVIKR